MSESGFILAICVFTVIGHLGLLWTRGWLIGELRREQNKMKVQLKDFEERIEKRMDTFEDEHQLPWARKGTQKKTA